MSSLQPHASSTLYPITNIRPISIYINTRYCIFHQYFIKSLVFHFFITVGNLVAQHPQSFPGVSSSTYNIAQQQSKQSENNTHNNSNGESSEDEDVHMCGGCKQQFSSYSVFRKHKKSCNIRKKTKPGESNPNLEATAISLLANQFNQTSNTTNRLRDDTDNSIPIWTQPNDEENADTADTGDNDDIEMNGTETGSLICLTMEDGQDQESNLGSLHSSLVTIPQMSSVPSESIREGKVFKSYGFNI